MPINLLSDVDVVALSIVDQGANRKRFYLRKQEANENLLTLPAPHKLVKAEGDWSVAYCVVAEPGAQENPGIHADDHSIDDVWASEDEIRKAAHKFMKNGALVNKMHETLEPYGSIVENFIAQADFQVDGETIKKGSWVIGLEPSDDGRGKIDKGEFTGVSIQGTGLRTLQKAAEEDRTATLRSEMALAPAERSFLTKIGEKLGLVVPEELKVETTQEDDEVALTDEQVAALAKVDGIDKTVTELTKEDGRLAGLESKIDTLLQRLPENEPTEEEKRAAVEATVAKMASDLEKAREDLSKLASGSSTQESTNTTKSDIEKGDADTQLASSLFG
jgi:Putative phage serine protease XkdF